MLLFAWLVIPGSILSFGFWFTALKLGWRCGYKWLSIPDSTVHSALISVPVLNATFRTPATVGWHVAVGAAVWLMSRSLNLRF